MRLCADCHAGWAVVPDLSRCFNLHQLSVGIQIKDGRPPVVHVVKKVVELLAIPPSAPLERLDIHIVFREVRMVDHLPEDMKPLDNAVTRLLEDHRAVGKVVVEYSVEGQGREDYEVVIRNMLPSLDTGQRLYVCRRP